MSFFISDAMAQGQDAAAGSDPLMSLLPFAVLMILLYFLMIRPQVKRQKAHKTLVEGLSKGDEIVSSGGVAGRVVEVGENFARVEIADKVVVKMRRQSVEQVLPKGSLKEL